MSPRDLQPPVLLSRLREMGRLLDDLDRVGEVDAAALAADRFLRHVVDRVLTQLVQLAVAVNSHVAAAELGTVLPDYRASFDAAAQVGLLSRELADALKPAVGLRNVLVHEYLDVDLAVVAAALPSARRDFLAYVQSAAGWLADRQASSG